MLNYHTLRTKAAGLYLLDLRLQGLFSIESTLLILIKRHYGLDIFKGKLMHSAVWDGNYDLTGNRVAVIGGGSSAVQIMPAIQPNVAHMTACIRTPGWVVTNFGAKYAGPRGSNFKYTESQLKEFNDHPEAYLKYCNEVEGELNRRFGLVRLHVPSQTLPSNKSSDAYQEQRPEGLEGARYRAHSGETWA